MRRSAKPATAAYLERAALHYLERYGGSAERVRRVLAKRVKRSVEELGTDAREGARAIDEVIAKLRRLGYVDDARFASARARSMRKRGKSARAVRAALAAQGIAPELVEEVLADEEGEDPELEAARAVVKRRRLGPHRTDEGARLAEKQRDLARLARAGFSYAVAVRALAGGDGLD